ncbi:hypothetical protein Dimus_006094, partial [Dionaea muscipula]
MDMVASAMEIEVPTMEVAVLDFHGNVTGKKRREKKRTVRCWFSKGRTRNFSDRA